MTPVGELTIGDALQVDSKVEIMTILLGDVISQGTEQSDTAQSVHLRPSSSACCLPYSWLCDIIFFSFHFTSSHDPS
jgi:hypothetical protein